ncbi:TetR/AcrR family transcriptional regulator [Kitasatospora sp. NPDC093558]|uniref:TetR/AcrR family transcriptional regulator n=1 Tax=Kitasatospora sp. NPDC093558 TaxID=3155201 RepID=UPI00344A0A90
MNNQIRAQRTYEALVRAAAVIFEGHGYENASLVEISTIAGYTRGALTYHFDSKADLAKAVVDAAAGQVREGVDRSCEAAGALEGLIGATRTVGGLLGESVTVRAAARLERDAPQPAWHAIWLHTVVPLLHRAAQEGDLLPHVDPDRLAVLLGTILRGWATIAGAATTADVREGLAARDALVWEILLPALLAPEAVRRLHNDGWPDRPPVLDQVDHE